MNKSGDLISYINTCQQTECNVLIKFVQRFNSTTYLCDSSDTGCKLNVQNQTVSLVISSSLPNHIIILQFHFPLKEKAHGFDYSYATLN